MMASIRMVFLHRWRVYARAIIALAFFVVTAPVVRAFTINDPLAVEQWYLTPIHVSEAWDRTLGSRAVIVAVVDSGVDLDHEDLTENIWTNPDDVAGDGVDNDDNGYVDDHHGWDFLANEPSPSPKFHGVEEAAARPIGVHHGTVVSGLIAAVANNGKGITGVAPRVQIMPLRALTSKGLGSVTSVVRAIAYAVDEGASVINVSFNVELRSPLLTAALRRARERGVVVIAAAGNDQGDHTGTDLDVAPIFPVCATGPLGEPLTIGVAATDREGQKAPFSYYGNRCVDIAAPGVDMIATQVQSPAFAFLDLYGRGWDGTSFATALVSGTAALIKSVYPEATPDDVRAILRASATDITARDAVYGSRMGAGLLNVARAVAIAASPGERTRARSALPPTSGVRSRIALTLSDGRTPTQVVVARPDGTTDASWYPFEKTYRGAASVVQGDVQRDGTDEIVVSAGIGGGPQVRLFTQAGTLAGHFFTADPHERGGTSVAVGDPNPSGAQEIVAVSGAGRPLHVQVFSRGGEPQLGFDPGDREVLPFGAHVRIGDVDGDGLDDIVVARGGLSSRIVVTNVLGEEKLSFSPYPETDDIGLLSLALGDIDGDGILEIITGRGAGEPEVRVWKRNVLHGHFLAYSPQFRNGISVAAGDVRNNGRDTIVVVPRAKGGAHVRLFSGTGSLVGQFFAAPSSWRGSMTAAVVR